MRRPNWWPKKTNKTAHLSVLCIVARKRRKTIDQIVKINLTAGYSALLHQIMLVRHDGTQPPTHPYSICLCCFMCCGYSKVAECTEIQALSLLLVQVDYEHMISLRIPIQYGNLFIGSKNQNIWKNWGKVFSFGLTNETLELRCFSPLAESYAFKLLFSGHSKPSF